MSEVFKQGYSEKLPGLLLGLLAFFATLFFFPGDGENQLLARMAAVVVLMAVWWVTEPVPFAVTAMLPFVLFPILGIQSAAGIAPAYFNSIIFLFLGGFLIALAIERWNLHRRIALHVLLWVGGSPRGLVFGFMAVCCFLSAWISNTATTLAMLPVAMAVLKKLEESHPASQIRPLGISLMLAIAYACSIGGVATPVGTPPNLAFRAIYSEMFPEGETISFAQWCLFAMPLSLVLLITAWWLLCFVLFRAPATFRIEHSILRDQLAALGKMSREEMIAASVFASTAFLWVFREPIDFGAWVLPGWQGLLPWSTGIDDGTVAVGMAVLLFLIPARDFDGRHTRMLTGSVIGKLPWGIILLFGGGYALARGFQESGLSGWVAQTFFQDFGQIGLPGMIVVTSLVMTCLTEFTSNTPSTQLVLPIVGSAAVAAGISPLLLMLPATLSASMSFMMPVGTPPNAIVFGTGRLRIRDMVLAGLILNAVGLVLITLTVLFPFRWVMGW
jgi:sodium-dependent dicarboxylate transporter 2/3/5